MQKASDERTSATDLPDVARRHLLIAAAALAVSPALSQTDFKDPYMTALTAAQLTIGPIAGSAAVGDIARLNSALREGLDAGLSISEVKEVLVQVYAYAGFPRALNALGELMKVGEDRRAKGIKDVPGRQPGEVPTGKALLEAGTANQTKLSGAPVRGPLFDFAPAIDFFLKTHLFGDIFARDNLDWQSRELATVAILSALSGVESQLLAHIRISVNVGLTADQLKQFGHELGEAQASQRLASALDKHLAGNAQQ
jgi:alkylhydroperoxidase/carboxymuconolactone decarboxylase family protein YurZ